MIGKITLTSLLLSAILIASDVSAKPTRFPFGQLVIPSAKHAPHVIAQARDMSLDDAVSLVRRRYGGKVVRSETVTKDGKRTHLVRVLKDGRVRTYRVDARSGSIR